MEGINFFWDAPVNPNLSEEFMEVINRRRQLEKEIYYKSNMTVTQLEENFEKRVKEGEVSGIEYGIFRNYQEKRLLLRCELALKDKAIDNTELLNDLSDFFQLTNMRVK